MLFMPVDVNRGTCFYCIVMKMLRNVILLTPELQSPEVTASSLTTAILKLSDPTSADEFDVLCAGAVSLLDTYLTIGNENSAHDEKSFREIHNGDMNAFLKSENLGGRSFPAACTSACHSERSFQYVSGRERVAKALLS